MPRMTPHISKRFRSVAVTAPAAALLLVATASPASAAVDVQSFGQVIGDGASDFISVTCAGGQLTANGDTAGELCAELTGVSVSAGAGIDNVQLGALTPAMFPALVGFSVDTADFSFPFEADNVTGSAIGESYTGDSADTINAGDGNDMIDGANSASGGAGDDSFKTVSSFASGGTGDDRFIQVTPSGGIDGGPGTDSWEVDFDQATLGVGEVTVSFVLSDTSLTVDVPGQGTQSVPGSGLEQIFFTLLREGTQSYDGSAFSGYQHVRGMAGPDTVAGGAHDDSLHGGTGDDTLNGNGGGDVLNGGAGNDTIQARDGLVDRIDCGDGTDTVVADAVDSVVNCESVQLPAVVTPPPPAPVVPDTSKVKGPAKVAKGTTAKFKLKSPTAGATFQCKLDKGKWKTCKATHKVKTTKLKVGKHKLRVRAVVAGTVDPTPAVKKFKVTS